MICFFIFWGVGVEIDLEGVTVADDESSGVFVVYSISSGMDFDWLWQWQKEFSEDREEEEEEGGGGSGVAVGSLRKS